MTCTMQSRLFLAAGIALLAAPAFCAVKVGDAAPPITVDALLPAQPVESMGPAALAGKAVVLEFWATWCGPCVDAIRHLNELADQFAGRPMRFLSVTGEEQAVVEKFLKLRPIRGSVGFDHGDRLLHAYGFDGIPVTVLIDAHGKVAGITSPDNLNAKVLEGLLAGNRLKLPPIPSDLIPVLSEADGPKPLVSLMIRPATGSNSSMYNGPGKYQITNFQVREIVSSAYDVPSEFVTGEAANDPARYDVSVIGPKSLDPALQKLRADALAIALNLNVKRETREVDGLLLKAPHGKPAGWPDAPSSGSKTMWGNGQVHMTGGDMAQLATIVRSVLHKPVANRTGLAARFDLELDYDQKRPESLLEVLRAAGLEFEPAKLPTEFLVANRAESSK
jgi:uncharacterized protein (TIGR03435 family)